MENKLKLEIVTPYGLIFSDEINEVVAPGSEGEFGVLPKHIPFLTTLKIGMLTYKKDSKTGHFFVNWGYAEIGPDKVLILTDSAEKAENIDVERAIAAKKRAEERFKQIENFAQARSTASLERALTRIQIADKKSAK
jgi:F-type H+-transporting ATPase subunit epsilon